LALSLAGAACGVETDHPAARVATG